MSKVALCPLYYSRILFILTHILKAREDELIRFAQVDGAEIVTIVRLVQDESTEI